MGLSTQDFVVAYRALGSRTFSSADLRKALKYQASRMEKGRRLTLAESLAEIRSLPPETVATLTSPAPVDLRADPATLETAGAIFLETEAASELELDRAIDALSRPADPKTLKDVPVPPSLEGYDVSWEIGRSRSGSVYRGSRRGTGAQVAIKVYRREVFATDAARRAFLDAIPERVPGDPADFVGVLERTDVDGTAVVVTEFVDGPTLASQLADRKVSPRRGFEIVGKVAAALHRAGVAHGALSARSIHLEKSDRPRLTQMGWTPGAAPVDDVAAMGAILYEIAAGVPPFGGFRSTELKAPSRHNASCAGPAERIILKALARDPARRYPDPGALSEDIGRFLRHEEVTAQVEAPEAVLPPRPKRKPWIPAIAAGVAAVALIVFLLLSRGEDAPKPVEPVVTGPPAPASAPVPPPAPRPPAPPRDDGRKAALARKGPLNANEERDFRFRATGYLAKREFEELDRMAEEALIRGPETSWAHHYRAIAAYMRNDFDAAMTHADRALAMGLEGREILELRFDLRLARAEYRASLAELARLYPAESVSAANQEIMRLNRDIERDARDPALLVRRGAFFMHRHLPGRAAEDFARAVAEGDSKADYFLAMALKEEDRIADAGAAVRRFLTAHAGLPGAVEAKAFLESLPH